MLTTRCRTLSFSLLMFASVCVPPCIGDDQQNSHATRASNKFDIEVPAKAPQKVTPKACAADFALSPKRRQESIKNHLKANPADANRLYSFAEASRSMSAPKLSAKALTADEIPTLNSPDISAKEQLAIVRQQQKIALIWGQKWPNGSTIHVRFLNTHPSWNPIKAKVEHFARQWEEFANITFAFDNSATAEIRILLATDDFSWSTIGTDAKNVPADQETMHYGWFNLETPDEEFSRTVIHEFGHALGAIHEHQHPEAGIPWNKPVVYAYYASANPPWSHEDVDVNMFQKYDASILQYGVYDPHSIMHYPIPPTFTTNGFSVGWNTELSDEDKSVIAWVYPKPH